MAIAAVNYPTPVQVNGFPCRNCSEVSLATKGIDPQHPESGAANRDAASEPTRAVSDPARMAAARRSAEAIMQTPVGYSERGAVTGDVAAGQIISAQA